MSEEKKNNEELERIGEDLGETETKSIDEEAAEKADIEETEGLFANSNITDLGHLKRIGKDNPAKESSITGEDIGKAGAKSDRDALEEVKEVIDGLIQKEKESEREQK